MPSGLAILDFRRPPGQVGHTTYDRGERRPSPGGEHVRDVGDSDVGVRDRFAERRGAAAAMIEYYPAGNVETRYRATGPQTP
jgi:hypothetical protein